MNVGDKVWVIDYLIHPTVSQYEIVKFYTYRDIDFAIMSDEESTHNCMLSDVFENELSAWKKVQVINNRQLELLKQDIVEIEDYIKETEDKVKSLEKVEE